MNKRLDEIRQRLGKATAGEWEIDEPDKCFVDVRISMGFGNDFDYNPRIGCGNKEQALKDATFIVHSKKDIAYLLYLVEKQQTALQKISKCCFPASDDRAVWVKMKNIADEATNCDEGGEVVE